MNWFHADSVPGNGVGNLRFTIHALSGGIEFMVAGMIAATFGPSANKSATNETKFSEDYKPLIQDG